MPQPPVMTPEQRAGALEKAKAARKVQAEVRDALKSGTLTLAEVLASGSDPAPGNDLGRVIARMKVSALLLSLPGVGRVRAEKFMAEQGIDAARRVRGLSLRQRRALEEQFPAPVPA